jgi:hypothetical protein
MASPTLTDGCRRSPRVHDGLQQHGPVASSS